jgi:hypothetical protein
MDIEAIAEKAQNMQAAAAASDPIIKQILSVVKTFIQSNRVMCYGGTAINNLLPENEQFYDPNYDIPDYDFYTETPQLHAMKLADIFNGLGFKNVEVKPGVHLLTFKVFVEYTGIADITYLEPAIFKVLWNENIVRDKIHYVSPNFLRMSMYLELSRPKGDVSRWSKVYKRLMLLNKEYPIGCSKQVDDDDSGLLDTTRAKIEHFLQKSATILMGVHATELHSKQRSNIWKLPVDVLVDESNFDKYTQTLAGLFGKETRTVNHEPYEELLPRHADITDKATGQLLVRVFQTMACHSFHELKSGMKVASIPTLLQFFFAFVYADAHYLEGFDQNRIICICQRLLDLAHSKGKRRFELLTPLECMGHQETLTEMRAHALKLRQDIKPESDDFLRFFFKYVPSMSSKSKRTTLKKRLRKISKKMPNTGESLVTEHEA